jgi:hypothetical protein
VWLTDWQADVKADAELRGIAFDGLTRIEPLETMRTILPSGVG